MVLDNIENSVYGRFINSSSFYLVCLDTQGCYTFVNQLFADRFSFISSNFIGQHLSIAVTPDDVEKTKEVIDTCLANPDSSFTLRFRISGKQGSLSWSQWEAAALKDNNGVTCGLLCLGYDISEKEHASLEALEYAQKIDNIIENITDGFLIIDRNWTIIRVNKVFEQYIGVSRNQVVGKVLWEVFPDHTYYHYPAAFRKAMQENTKESFLDYNEVEQRWYKGTVYPSEEGITVIFSDVTEKKQTEERIRESGNKLAAILNSTSDINILIDPEYKILSFNKTAYESTKVLYEGKQLTVGQSVLEYIIPGTVDAFKANFQKALQGVPLEEKIKLFFKPGVALWFLAKYFPVFDADGKTIGVAFNSINIDKEQRQYEKLEEIASMYSHEIRRPVATILGITQLINSEDLNGENKQWFGHLRKTTLELDQVIHQIVTKTSEIG